MSTNTKMTTGLDAAELIAGVSPVLEVPFTDDGGVDWGGFRTMVRHVLSTGVTSVMFPGYASEFLKLTEAERGDLTVALVEEADRVGNVAVIAAVQDHATRLAVERARWSVEAGAHAINLLPPYQLNPSTEAVEAHIRAVLGAAPETPVVVQYAPNETGNSISASTLAQIAADHPNFMFVKVESSPPGPYITQLAELAPSLRSLEGYAGVQLPDAFRRGVVGTQPGCSFVEIYQQIWKLYKQGDFETGDRLHARLLPYISYWMLETELIITVEKMISVRRGMFASDHCRAPARTLDSVERARIDEFLEEFSELLPEVN